MAYNNGFPVGYQQYYSPQYYPQMQQNQQPVMQTHQNQQPAGSIIWVQGIGGARNYLLSPNETAVLWDSESQVIYLKSADASGMPSMKILDYTIRENQNEENLATKDDINALRNDLERMKSRLDALSSKKDNRKEYKNE